MSRRTLSALLLLASFTLSAQSPADALKQGFTTPPDSAKPRVWWHWMNGNISKEGIRQDLEWMKRVGIGGFQNFDAALATPQVVDKRLVYMTPEWKDAFRYTATLADQLHLEMAIAASPGWSESGGPWVTPAQAMKKYVWSETRVPGGRPFTGTLAKPPAITGPFQSIPFTGRVTGGVAAHSSNASQHYADSAVVAYRLPASELASALQSAKVSSSAPNLNIAILSDGDLARTFDLPIAPVNDSSWILYEFPAPQTLRAFTLVVQGLTRGFGRVNAPTGQDFQASDDGMNFRTVFTIPPGGANSKTFSFPPVTAKYFRLLFRTLPPIPGAVNLAAGAAPPSSYPLTELTLHPGARIHRAEEKSAFSTLQESVSASTPAVPRAEAFDRASFVDLTSRLRPDGTLDWTPPPGDWLVLRFGYSLLGTMNHPASPEATGLEVDKLSRAHVKAYVENYLDQYKATVGPLMGKRGLQYFIIDSYEAGAANWTEELLAEFQKRRGYDARPWLATLTGRVVDSAEASDRFLWDFRQTLSALMTEYHYEQIGDSLHARGMGRYTESHEVGRAYIGDGMEVKRKAEVPMSAMWTPRPGTPTEYFDADIRESASVAHIYGQNIAAAESLTAAIGAWSFSPETLKTTADREMAMGLNRFVIHTSVHQPVDDHIPGLSLGQFGQWFNRHETWAESAKPWISYLTRSCFLLQQGRFAADIAYYYGDDSNVTALFSRNPPPIPAGFAFDYVNTDALLTRFSAAQGRLSTPSGMSYRLLLLDPNSRHMTVAVLRKLKSLVAAGVTVAGPKPLATPTNSDSQPEFQSLVNELWGAGKIAAVSPAEALSSAKLQPDFDYSKPRTDTTLYFVHRHLADGELYWVNNRQHRAEDLEATFRLQGKAPEFWYPETGRTAPAPYRTENGRTIVPLHLDPDEAVFVLFRQPATAPSRSIPRAEEKDLLTLAGPWSVAFQPNRGAPPSITLPNLSSFTDSADAGVRYFSGTATYSKSFDAAKDWLTPGAHLFLDLGDVKNLAEVSLNGKPLGLVWKLPFRLDITSALQPGANRLEVKVTNLWVNRLVGDQQPGVAKPFTYTSQRFYQADSPLLPSGLLGPVRVVRR